MISAYGETPLEAVEHSTLFEEQPPPDTKALAAHDVVVAIRSASVGWVDLIMAGGLYQHLLEPPYCPGLEYSGIVQWVGSAVGSHKVGDRVLLDGLQAGPRSSSAYQRYGGFASYGVAPQTALLPIPNGFNFDQATRPRTTAW